MSISLYEIYATNCIDLARSIIIKSEAVADAINRIDAEYNAGYINIGREPFYDPYDRYTWRYYQNLAGIYHPLDIGLYTHYDHETQVQVQTDYIKIYSVDTHELIDFTVENLKEHRATLREYRKGSTYYQKLVEKYPHQRLLIDGILNPIPIEKAIAARENEIIYYDNTLVEENEFHLIPRIQDYIDRFFSRWNNEDYALTDNLYIPSRLGIMYIYLPYVIMNLRYDASRSIEAHTFHVWNYLGSHQWLDEYRYHLNLYQRMWFYRNIRWSELNAGKLSTFKKHIDVIMTNRNLPIGEYYSRKNFENIDNDGNVFDVVPYFELSPLNLDDHFLTSDKYRDPTTMVDKESKEGRDNHLDNNIRIDREAAETGFRYNPDDSISTKVVETRVNDMTKRQAIKRQDVEINEWIYMTVKGMYTARISVSNPTNAEYLNMSQPEALIVFIYALMKGYGLDPVWIPTITADNVLKLRKPKLEKVRSLMDPKFTPYLYAYAIDDIVFEPPKIISTEAFSEFCYKVWELRNKHRQIYSFTHDSRQHAQVKSMTHQYYDTVVCKLTDRPTTFEDYFRVRGWKLYDTNDEIRNNKDRWTPKLYQQLASDILKYSTGNDLTVRQSAKEIQGMMVRLLRKLSSYSIQILKDIVDEDIVPIDWAYMRYNRAGIKGLAKTYTNMNTLDFTQHRRIGFHKSKESLMGKFIDGQHRSAWGDSSDTLNLILDLDNDDLGMTRSASRLPSVRFKMISSTIPGQSPSYTISPNKVGNRIIDDKTIYDRYK